MNECLKKSHEMNLWPTAKNIALRRFDNSTVVGVVYAGGWAGDLSFNHARSGHFRGDAVCLQDRFEMGYRNFPYLFFFLFPFVI